MDLGDLVDYACSCDIDNLPADIVEPVRKSIIYIRELYDQWNVVDMEDFDWWLDQGYGPLLDSIDFQNVSLRMSNLKGLPKQVVATSNELFFRSLATTAVRKN